MSITTPVNIVSAEFKANPFPFLADLRNSRPVYRTTLPDKTPVWLVTRYEDVAALLRDERFVKNRRAATDCHWDALLRLYGRCRIKLWRRGHIVNVRMS